MKTFEALETKVKYDKKSKKITCSNETTKMVLQLKSKKVIVNDKTIKLKTPVQLIEGELYIPLELVKSGLGAKYSKDDDEILITSSQSVKKQELYKKYLMDRYTINTESDEKISLYRKYLNLVEIPTEVWRISRAIEVDKRLLKSYGNIVSDEVYRLKNEIIEYEEALGGYTIEDFEYLKPIYEEFLNMTPIPESNIYNNKLIDKKVNLLKYYEASLSDEGLAYAQKLRGEIEDIKNTNIKNAILNQINLEGGKRQEALKQLEEKYNEEASKFNKN